MARMSQAFDVCVRGGGIVGHTLALLLARDGLRVGLVAPAPDPTDNNPDVRAYALNARSRQLLSALRCWPDDLHATEVLAMQVKGDAGGTLNFAAGALQVPGLTWIVDVPALERQLAQAVHFQPRIVRLTAPQPASLTVICEGRASSTRGELGVEVDSTPYDQHAIAARLQCEEPHGQTAHQWFGQGDILALLPLGGPAGREVALVWSVPAARAPALLNASPEEFGAAVTATSGACLGRLSLSSARAAWPLQLACADRWVGQQDGRAWALAGDAAHSVHPLAGQGLNLGLADVETLAQVLRERDYWRQPGDARLLRRYERTRKAEVVPMGRALDGLQQLFAQPGSTWQSLRNWGMTGVERSGPLKHWLARRAMGQP
jgi:2-polyprenyl-6-methoxyphenol hydroxylase-like FAD-dependent oxidoreductase